MTKPKYGLWAFYANQPGKESGLFPNSPGPHRASWQICDINNTTLGLCALPWPIHHLTAGCGQTNGFALIIRAVCFGSVQIRFTGEFLARDATSGGSEMMANRHKRVTMTGRLTRSFCFACTYSRSGVGEWQLRCRLQWWKPDLLCSARWSNNASCAHHFVFIEQGSG